MASNDDLDDFFKKKDRKGNKAKKQTALLTNNEEMLKQSVIGTSPTTAFRKNMHALGDDEEYEPANDESIVGTVYTEEAPKPSKPKLAEANKRPTEQHVQLASNTDGQQDDWEEFEDVPSKYEQLRLKFGRGANDDNEPDDDDYDDDHPNNNDNNNEATGDSEQRKDRPVWKVNRVQRDDVDEEQQKPEPVEQPKVEEAKPVAIGVYRPPQMRTGSSVTAVGSSSGTNPTRVAKKKEPNLSSVDEFPSLRATVNKK